MRYSEQLPPNKYEDVAGDGRNGLQVATELLPDQKHRLQHSAEDGTNAPLPHLAGVFADEKGGLPLGLAAHTQRRISRWGRIGGVPGSVAAASLSAVPDTRPVKRSEGSDKQESGAARSQSAINWLISVSLILVKNTTAAR